MKNNKDIYLVSSQLFKIEDAKANLSQVNENAGKDNIDHIIIDMEDF